MAKELHLRRRKVLDGTLTSLQPFAVAEIRLRSVQLTNRVHFVVASRAGGLELQKDMMLGDCQETKEAERKEHKRPFRADVGSRNLEPSSSKGLPETLRRVDPDLRQLVLRREARVVGLSTATLGGSAGAWR